VFRVLTSFFIGDDTRVLLRSVKGSDYINANYVEVGAVGYVSIISC